mgnify:CR=1 FL=1
MVKWFNRKIEDYVYLSDGEKRVALIIGADNIINFKKWKNYEELLTYNIIIMTRNNIDILKYTSHLSGKFTVINDYNFTDISSTKIRNKTKYRKKRSC